MGKKKKKVYKVWCYYCEREFDDEKILIQHQKAKHFKCHVCHKKLSTAGGMQIHVLQVHKESITKVPNAKPDRESIDIEIFGMDGIPPEILAAHDGEDGYDEDEQPSKMARFDFPPYGTLGGGSNAFGMAPQPLYAMPPAYAPRPAILPTPSQQGWYSMQTPGPPVMPPRPPQPPQPLFPIQNVSQPPSQPLFPIRSTMPPSSMPQPLFPVNGSATGSPNLSVSMPLVSTPSLTGSPAPPGSIAGQSAALYTGGMPSSFVSGGLFAGQPTIYTTDGIPPAIANKPQGPPVVNEVYLLWDDEAMSMEERRLSLPQYQVVDETLQMDSVDAAIDKRIQESRLAGRMSFKV